MIKLFEGGFHSLAKEEMKKEILRLTSEKKQVYLIVPEQKTVSAEKEMSEFLPSYAPLTFEVTNFTRLANSVFRSIGGIAGEYSDKAKEALIMWRTLTELSPFLTLTGGRKEINTGIVMKALSAVKEMKSISVLPEEIESLKDDERIQTNKHLSRKLSDISMIMTLYKKLLSEKYSDIGDDIETLSKVLTENKDFFKDTHFFVEGFTSFTEPQYDLLGILIQRCEVSVLLPIPKAGRDNFEFTELKDTEERIIQVADKVGAEKKLIRPDGRNPMTNPILGEISDLLWKSFGNIGENANFINGCIRIFEASDPYEECEFVLSDIKRRVMAGASYRDFAIVARNADDYSGIICSSAESLDIPIFMSKSKDIFTFEGVKLIYTAYSVIESGFDRESVIAYMKCGLLGIDREACDEFELYTEKWQISGDRFTDGIMWNMNPDGLTGRKKHGSDEKLLRIDGVRRKITEPLMRFKENISEAKTVADHAEALLSFLTEIDLEAAVNDRRDELINLGEDIAAHEHDGLWRLICDSLDTMHETLGEMNIDARGFENQLKIVQSFLNLGRIPSHYDEVTVGSADMLRLSDKKHVYLIGVNNGEFPRAAKSSSYFTDRDKIILTELGLIREDDSTAYARELFAFSRTFSTASEDVTLLYSLRDASFTNTTPADVIARLDDIACGMLKPIRISSLSAEERIYSPTSALDLAAKKGDESDAVRDALKECGYGNILNISKKSIRNTDLSLDTEALKLAYPGDLSLTQTRIDTYVGCPLLYYLKYDLKLSENERAQFDARNIGTFIHAILENFFNEAGERGEKISEIDEKSRHDMVLRAAKQYLSSINEESNPRTKRGKIMLDRLCRAAMPVVNGLCDEFADCEFLPRFFELEIGNDDPTLPTPAKFTTSDGRSAYLYGSIDRVDTFKSENGDVYVRVIDYKTGSKTFSPSDLDEGKNLQMFLYLHSVVESESPEFLARVGVENGKKLIPAGVIYVKTDMSDVTVPHSDNESAEAAVKKKQARRGMILDEPESIAAMNPAYIPIKFKKNGETDTRYAKFLYSREGWDEITEKISAKVGEISDNIKSGDISAAKDKNNAPCEYCKFKPICRSSKKQ